MIGYNPQEVEEPTTMPKDLLDALMKDYAAPLRFAATTKPW